MRKFLILISLMILSLSVACDKEVSRKVVSTKQVESVESCNDGPAGICGKFDMTYKGNYKYWLGLHAQCPGHQTNLNQIDLVETIYEDSDHKRRTEQQSSSTLVRHETECR